MEKLNQSTSAEARVNHEKDIRQIFTKYLYHWPLFLISIALCMGMAIYYLNHTRPLYLVKAKLAIKDDKSKASPEKAAALQQLNISTESKLVESEVEILQSRPLIKSVVDKLQLWCTYTTPGEYGNYDIYATTPVKLKLIKQTANFNGYSCNVYLKNKNEYTVTFNTGKQIDATFKTVFSSAFGHWQLAPTANVNKYIGKTFTINLTDQDLVISGYQNSISTVLSKKSPLIELKIQDEVPERGTEILNYLISVYKTFNIIDKNKETESTLKFIDERLASLTGELTDVEKNVEGYKSSIGLTDISSKSQYYLNNIQSIDGRLNEVNVQLNVINGIERYVNNENNAESAPATIGITDPGLTNMVAQLTKLQLDRDKLLAITPATNPIFIPINRQINSLKMAVKENIKNIKVSLVNTQKQFQKINSTFESSIKNIPGQERHYVSIKRQQAIKENLYVYLLEKREEIALSYASTLADARTVEEAYYEPPQSKKKFTLSFAFVIGLCLPIGLIYGRETIKNRVLTRNEIETTTDVSIISELIQNTNKTPIVIQQGSGSQIIGEQFRALRTNLLHISPRKEKGKVTLFTSSIPGEGKSYVASNMGASLAALGRKTIILELDLRKPKITKIFNLDPERMGISDLLSGEITKEEIIQPSGINPNLFVMSAGSIRSNPSELLENEEMEILISELRYEYDNILIDSPPLRLVTDAMILAPLSDVTIYLIRQGYTGKEELKFIKQLQIEHRLPNMRLVFNGIQRGKHGYGYHYSYNYYNQKEKKVNSFNIKSIFNRF